MKHRILFVDDDAAALRRVATMLRGQPEDWEFIFAQSGNAALVELANQPCEVVFADLHMPGMSGAELLQEVRMCYPRTVRFLLASAADTEFITRSGGDVHQFLAKPCEEAALKAALASALSLDTWLTNENIKAHVAKMRTFRSLPSLYVEVLKVLQSPNASAEHIGEIVVKDLAMTTKLLQTVNSAFFALPRRVTSPTEAVIILGTETVKSLVMSIQTYAELDKLKPIYFSMDKLWRHNMAVATWAKLLTQLVTNDAKMADEAFTAGMFHDIGKLVLASNLAEAYSGVPAEAAQRGLPATEIEQEIFGATHAETGAYLLGLWGLPYPILEAIALHHSPGRTANPEFSPLTAVHVANVFVHEHEPDKDGWVAPPLDAAYIEALGLTERLDYWREMLFAQLSDRPATMKRKPAPPAPQPASAKPSATTKPAPSPAMEPVQVEASPPVPSGISWWPHCFAAAACLLLAVTGILFVRSLSSNFPTVAARKPAPAFASTPRQTTAPTATPGEAKPESRVEAPPAAPGTPPLKLQGIYYRKDRPSAIIEGRTLWRGDTIKGGRVIAIDQQSVTLDFDGERVVLSVRKQ